MRTRQIPVIDKNSRAYQENKALSAVNNVLLVVVFTAINVLIAAFGGSSYFLFSATVPFFSAYLGRMLYDETGKILPLVLFAIGACIVIGVYLLFWIMARRNRNWMIPAIVFFVLDTVLLFVLFPFTIEMILDYLFHAWVLFSLISGYAAARRAAAMPPDVIPAQAEEIPGEISTADPTE